MVLAYHVIMSFYGFWLPNDPRGSWSDFVASWDLFRYGPATKVDTHESVAHAPHDRAARLKAKQSLRYPPVLLTGLQARAVARGFAIACDDSSYVILACAILPDHVHLVIERNDRPIAQIVSHLKGRATQELKREDLHPFDFVKLKDGSFPSPWAQKYWKVFVDTEEYVKRAVDYVECNPEKEGKKKQKWSFVRNDVS
jgi:REP element-mobilizing transposase RayT